MKTLTIEKSFNAPIEKVWEAFTNPEVLKSWYTPVGMSNEYISTDLKEGGLFRYCFKITEGEAEFWGRGRYIKLDEPNYLSYADSFTDADGNDVAPSHYGVQGDAVVETLVEIFLTNDGEKTTVKLVAENPYDEKMTADMTDGWNGMLSNLTTVFK